MDCRLIVNVDDLGLHPAVRRAVERLAAVGTVTSATLLVNGPDFAQAVGCRAVPVGVHLNVVRGRPILPPDAVRSLVDREGLFLGSYGVLLARYLAGRLRLEEIEAEWDAQIARAREGGLDPSHLDSEKHTHALPRLMPVAQRLARRHAIPWVRRPVERLHVRGVPAGGFARLALLGWFSLFHRPAAGVAWADSAWGIAEQGSRLTPHAFARYARRLRSGSIIEIACHPGLPEDADPALPAEYGRLRVAAQWLLEYNSLSDPAWFETLGSLGVTLVSYARIRRRGDQAGI